MKSTPSRTNSQSSSSTHECGDGAGCLASCSPQLRSRTSSKPHKQQLVETLVEQKAGITRKSPVDDNGSSNSVKHTVSRAVEPKTPCLFDKEDFVVSGGLTKIKAVSGTPQLGNNGYKSPCSSVYYKDGGLDMRWYQIPLSSPRKHKTGLFSKRFQSSLKAYRKHREQKKRKSAPGSLCQLCSSPAEESPTRPGSSMEEALQWKRLNPSEAASNEMSTTLKQGKSLSRTRLKSLSSVKHRSSSCARNHTYKCQRSPKDAAIASPPSDAAFNSKSVAFAPATEVLSTGKKRRQRRSRNREQSLRALTEILLLHPSDSELCPQMGQLSETIHGDIKRDVDRKSTINCDSVPAENSHLCIAEDASNESFPSDWSPPRIDFLYSGGEMACDTPWSKGGEQEICETRVLNEMTQELSDGDAGRGTIDLSAASLNEDAGDKLTNKTGLVSLSVVHELFTTNDDVGESHVSSYDIRSTLLKSQSASKVSSYRYHSGSYVDLPMDEESFVLNSDKEERNNTDDDDGEEEEDGIFSKLKKFFETTRKTDGVSRTCDPQIEPNPDLVSLSPKFAVPTDEHSVNNLDYFLKESTPRYLNPCCSPASQCQHDSHLILQELSSGPDSLHCREASDTTLTEKMKPNCNIVGEGQKQTLPLQTAPGSRGESRTHGAEPLWKTVLMEVQAMDSKIEKTLQRLEAQDAQIKTLVATLGEVDKRSLSTLAVVTKLTQENSQMCLRLETLENDTRA